MNRPSELPPLSESQMEVMQEIWARGEATVTDVWQAIAAKRDVARNTILTVMDRLEQKGWLEKRPVANSHLFKATVNQKKTLGKVVRELMDHAFEGSAGQMIVALLENSELSKDELNSIVKLIEAKKKNKKTES